MLGENLKTLRRLRNLSQEEVSVMLGIPRSSYSGYENNVAEPSAALLIKISEVFRVTLDLLLKEDLNSMSEKVLNELDKQNGFLEGSNLRILAISTDEDNNNRIELVNEGAKAGYTTGYADPEFISVLPAFNLPFLSRQKKYRAFPVNGDSMPPVSNGSYVIGEFVENLRFLPDGFPYIVVTKSDGIVFKIVHNQLEKDQTLLLSSTNVLYKPYTLPVSEVIEMWKFVNYICSEINEFRPDENEIGKSIKELQKEVAELKTAINAN